MQGQNILLRDRSINGNNETYIKKCSLISLPPSLPPSLLSFLPSFLPLLSITSDTVLNMGTGMRDIKRDRKKRKPLPLCS